jgi:16S rRNA (uracil1498-N3)-methyltransferase
MIRLFVNKKEVDDKSVAINQEQFHYLVNVLRVKSKTLLDLVIDQKINRVIEVKEINSEKILYNLVTEEELIVGCYPKLILVQCLPKQDKFSDILKKCTEVGVDSFIPIISSRTVPVIDTKAQKNKLSRWERILESAAAQSKRNKIPALYPIMTIASFIKWNDLIHPDFGLKLVFWEEETEDALKKVLKATDLSKINNIILFIGPEGGLSKAEVANLKKAGFLSVSLGQTILRVENAGFAAAANTLYELGG